MDDIQGAAGEEIISRLHAVGCEADWKWRNSSNPAIVGKTGGEEDFMINFHSGGLIDLDIGFYAEDHEEVNGRYVDTSTFHSVDETALDLSDPSCFDKIVSKISSKEKYL